MCVVCLVFNDLVPEYVLYLHVYMVVSHNMFVLTLSADHYDRDVCAERTELAVELIKLLETGLILQTEDQDHCINPAAELKRGRGRKHNDEVCRYFRFAY